MSCSRPFVIVLTLVVGLSVGGPLRPAGATQAAPAVLTVVHGVRGLVADVRLDGSLVLSGFSAERVSDAVAVRAGTHRLQVWPAGAASRSTPLVDTVIKVLATQRVTVALGVGPGGQPLVKQYDDADLLAFRGGAALVVRGLADAPGVLVTVKGRARLSSLKVGQQVVQQVPAGTYTVSAEASGGALIPPQDVQVLAGTAVVLYVIGSSQQHTLGWVAQVVRPSADAAPARIETGVGPVPTAPSGPPLESLIIPVLLVVLPWRQALSRRCAV